MSRLNNGGIIGKQVDQPTSNAASGKWNIAEHNIYKSLNLWVEPLIAATAAYFTGGLLSGSPKTNIDKYSFTTETMSSTSANLTVARYGGSAFNNKQTAAFILGGHPNNTSTPSNVVDKLLFSTETVSSIATLSTAVYGPFGMSNPSIAGYAGGGYNAGFKSFVDKWFFSNDTRSTLSTGLSSNAYQAAGFSYPAVAGYVAGGDIGSYANNYIQHIDKFLFSSDTRSTLSAWLSKRTGDTGSIVNIPSAAYIILSAVYDGVSAYPANGVADSTINKMSFPSETRSVLTRQFATFGSRGISNKSTDGYIYRGPTLSAEKLNFTTETFSIITISPTDTRSATTMIENA